MTTSYAPNGTTYHTGITVPVGTDKPRAVIFSLPFSQVADNAESVRVSALAHNVTNGSGSGTTAVPSVSAIVTGMAVALTPKVGDSIEAVFYFDLAPVSSSSEVAIHLTYQSASQAVTTMPGSARAITVAGKLCLVLAGNTTASYAETYTIKVVAGLNVANDVNFSNNWALHAKAPRGSY